MFTEFLLILCIRKCMGNFRHPHKGFSHLLNYFITSVFVLTLTTLSNKSWFSRTYVLLTPCFAASTLCDLLSNGTLFLVFVLEENCLTWRCFLSTSLNIGLQSMRFLKISSIRYFRLSVTYCLTSDVSTQVTPQVTGCCVVVNRRRGTTLKQISLVFMDFNGGQDDEFSEAACLDYSDSNILLRSRCVNNSWHVRVIITQFWGNLLSCEDSQFRTQNL